MDKDLFGRVEYNLLESIEDVERGNELRRIRTIGSSIEEYVLTILEDRNER